MLKATVIGAAVAVIVVGAVSAQQRPAQRQAPVVTQSPEPAYADRPVAPPAAPMEPLTLELHPGTQGIVTLNQPYSQVLLGDVAIADALPKSDTVIVVQGKKPGFTDLIIMRQDKLVQKIAIVVGAARQANRVYMHSPGRNLHEYTSYECPPGGACVRVADPFQRGTGNQQTQPIVVVPTDIGQPGSSGIQVVTPP